MEVKKGLGEWTVFDCNSVSEVLVLLLHSSTARETNVHEGIVRYDELGVQIYYRKIKRVASKAQWACSIQSIGSQVMLLELLHSKRCLLHLAIAREANV